MRKFGMQDGEITKTEGPWKMNANSVQSTAPQVENRAVVSLIKSALKFERMGRTQRLQKSRRYWKTNANSIHSAAPQVKNKDAISKDHACWQI